MNIQSKLIDKNLPPIEPIYDTWNYKSDVGSWGLAPFLELSCLSIQEINSWYVKSILNTLESFSNLARIRRMVVSKNEKSSGVIEDIFDLTSNIKYSDYIEQIIKAIENYSFDIYDIEMQIDMFVFVRTQEFLGKPIRGWVKNLGDFCFSIDKEDQNSYIYLNIENTLFYPFSYQDGEDNTEIFNLNQPLLTEALRNWEQKFNAEIAFEGLPGIYKYGFLPYNEWNKS